MGAYGYVNRATANTLYKRYKKWFIEKYGTAAKPLSFSDWLKWAKHKGIVQSADGDPNEVNIEADDSEVKQVPEDISKELTKPSGIGRGIAVGILFFSTIGIIAALMPSSQPQQAASVPTV